MPGEECGARPARIPNPARVGPGAAALNFKRLLRLSPAHHRHRPLATPFLAGFPVLCFLSLSLSVCLSSVRPLPRRLIAELRRFDPNTIDPEKLELLDVYVSIVAERSAQRCDDILINLCTFVWDPAPTD